MEKIKEDYLGLRDCLNISKKINFGFEIEFEDANIDQIKKDLISYNFNKMWYIKDDFFI